MKWAGDTPGHDGVPERRERRSPSPAAAVPQVTLAIPEEFVETIAVRAAELVVERLRNDAPGTRSVWLAGAKQAAAHLGWPVDRVYKHVSEIPHYRHGNRLMFRADELDAWVEGQRERVRSF